MLLSDKYLTPKELADKLAVSRESIYQYIRSGKLKAKRLGRRNKVYKRAPYQINIECLIKSGFDPIETYINTKQAGVYLNVGSKIISYWAKNKKIKGFKFLGQWRIARSAIPSTGIRIRSLQAASILGMTRERLRQLRAKKKIDGIKVGSIYYYSLESAQEYKKHHIEWKKHCVS